MEFQHDSGVHEVSVHHQPNLNGIRGEGQDVGKRTDDGVGHLVPAEVEVRGRGLHQRRATVKGAHLLVVAHVVITE